ncbi:hypothetical protein BEP19_15230 [Ammoniphilus oxalaticus]|uniref:NodB homology domain-containing protein n=1 Tax=Ammoniphilus oxalaticus TaxID=66863 RepID=A0A419SD76_9BACL|nr:exo-beta-N-acetylmuramidase NamZ domain-containing protein [Ammoniphilus oxalaticus]RKD21031.1 hypothetical protein BEP19_15230 [Ammoniphilus oxalaticus]
MKKQTYWIALALILLLVGQTVAYALSSSKLQLGDDLLIPKYHHLIDGKRVGVITNQTGVNSQGVHIIDELKRYPEAALTAIFVPEHGLDGKAKAGEYVQSYTHPELGIPVFSLYGKTRKPSKEMLDTVDVLVYDIQDIGARTYTYISTLNYCMIAAQQHGKKVIVLDRPNPLGAEIVDGPVLEEGYQTFVGVDLLPMAHGMTVGELAQFFNRNIHADLTIVPMEGYERGMLFEETGLRWIASSPNIPDLTSLKGYMATGLGEGTGIVQRDQFKWIGGKGIDSVQYAQKMNGLLLPGIEFIAETHGSYGGVRLQITNRKLFNPAKTGIYALAVANQLGSFEIPQSGNQLVMFDKIMGTRLIGDSLRLKLAPQEIEQKYAESLNQFKKQREEYLIYGNGKQASPVLQPQLKKISMQGGLVYNGKYFAPLRPVIEALGYTVGWEETTKTVMVKAEGREIPLQPGSDPTQDDAFIKDGITYIPTDMIMTIVPDTSVQLKEDQVIITRPLLELSIHVVPYVPPVVKPVGKIAYLTFDDGPSPLTSQVLDILMENDVKATFFLVGNQITGHEAVVKRMYDEGHSIGGHSYSHDYGHIYRNSTVFFEDLDKGYDAIARVIGVRPTIFRFPGGSNNLVSKRAQDRNLYRSDQWIMKDLVKQAKQRGEDYFDWNVSNGDASGSSYTVRSAVNKVIEGASGKQEIVILSHDSAPKVNTVKALPEIIEYLRQEDYSFHTLDQQVEGFKFLQ